MRSSSLFQKTSLCSLVFHEDRVEFCFIAVFSSKISFSSLGKGIFFLILFKNAIRKWVDILIAFKISLIVFSISQGENKICSIENKISPWEIENKPILVMRQNCVISIRRSFSWILNHSRVFKMRIMFTNLFVLSSLVLLHEGLNYECLSAIREH